LYIRPLLFDTFIIYSLFSLLGRLVAGVKPARYPYHPIPEAPGLAQSGNGKGPKKLASLRKNKGPRGFYRSLLKYRAIGQQ
jgi:hypothetical protein